MKTYPHPDHWVEAIFNNLPEQYLHLIAEIEVEAEAIKVRTARPGRGLVDLEEAALDLKRDASRYRFMRGELAWYATSAPFGSTRVTFDIRGLDFKLGADGLDGIIDAAMAGAP